MFMNTAWCVVGGGGVASVAEDVDNVWQILQQPIARTEFFFSDYK
jgi:hypothetical protein